MWHCRHCPNRGCDVWSCETRGEVLKGRGRVLTDAVPRWWVRFRGGWEDPRRLVLVGVLCVLKVSALRLILWMWSGVNDLCLSSIGLRVSMVLKELD